ncbi:MAG TPA: hypothetical protein VGO40_22550 [Longimicrobium sp.]|nr:hypothetical protein [Longimicrobium sp.]
MLTPKYREVYDELTDEATARGFAVQWVVFPGQGPSDGGELIFEGSLASTLRAAAEFRPHWVIARSYGCLVAVAAAGTGAEWVRDCHGMALWGPCTGRTTQARWGTDEKEAATIESYAKHGTRLATGFYTTMPAIEDRIKDARCSLRIVRGERDEYNTEQDIEKLHALHTAAQPGFRCEKQLIADLEHHVIRRETTPPEKWAEYCDALFRLISN